MNILILNKEQGPWVVNLWIRCHYSTSGKVHVVVC